jgi:hypothetical protein
VDPGERVRPRADRRYRRKTPAGTARPDLASATAIDSASWLHARRWRAWDDADEKLRRELVASSFGAAELIRMASDNVPRWIREAIPGRLYACAPFVAAVLTAHRAGAFGVLASYPELAAVFDVHRSTIERWVSRLQKAGLIEVITTWQECPGASNGGRGFWKNLYRPGPALGRLAGSGLLERAPGLEPAAAERAGQHARRARRRVRVDMSATRDRLWKQKRQWAAKWCAKRAEASKIPAPSLNGPRSSYAVGVSAPASGGTPPTTGEISKVEPQAAPAPISSRPAERPATAHAPAGSSPPDRGPRVRGKTHATTRAAGVADSAIVGTPHGSNWEPFGSQNRGNGPELGADRLPDAGGGADLAELPSGIGESATRELPRDASDPLEYLERLAAEVEAERAAERRRRR